MILRTLRSISSRSNILISSLPVLRWTEKAPFIFQSTQNKANITYSFNSKFFSTTKSESKSNDELNGIISELESQSLENFEEPFVPQEDHDQINALRKSINQSINLGNYNQGHEDAYKYVQLIRKYYGTSHPALYSALNNLALIYKLTGEFENAKTLYTKIMEGYLKIFGSKHLSTVVVMQNLANLLREMQEFESSITLYEDVLAIRREIQPERRVDHAVCLSSMAGAYRELKQYEKSEKYLEEALEIFIAELGEDHLNTATCLNNMALTYKKQKKFAKAEPLYLRALKVREAHLNELHPDVIAIKHNLGELYFSMNEPEKAKDYMIEAMEAIKKLEEESR